MPTREIIRTSAIVQTARVQQLSGMFDVPPSMTSQERWSLDFTLPDAWSIGAIVGPSGAGKTTVAREVFGNALVGAWDWPADKSVLDGFPAAMSIKEIVALLSSVGFSSPPSWVRPFHVLSNGEQFRVSMARTLAEQPDLAVVDEFTSVVDRTVAQIGAAAIAKTVRRRKQRFVAVTCHYDVLDWLEPDWIYQPHTGQFDRDCLRQRPEITLTVQRVHRTAWQLFRKHHYLDTSLNTAAVCFVAFWRDVPVAFSAWLGFPGHGDSAWREHRTVCLPDYQGVGIGSALSDYCASLFAGLGSIAFSTTSHPAMTRSRAAGRTWRMVRAPARSTTSAWDKLKRLSQARAVNRLSAGFRYVGPPLDAAEAQRVYAG